MLGKVPMCNFLNTKKPQRLLRLGFGLDQVWRLAEYGRVKLVACNLAVQFRLKLAATFARHSSLRRPFLDGLRCQPEQIAQRSLTSSDANGFCDSGFHRGGLELSVTTQGYIIASPSTTYFCSDNYNRPL